MNTNDLMSEVTFLSVEERAYRGETLLESVNSKGDATTAVWLAVANRRCSEVVGGQVQTVQAEQVFERIWQRYA